jgi:NAD-dependent SIR2 family protein deacetylase
MGARIEGLWGKSSRAAGFSEEERGYLQGRWGVASCSLCGSVVLIGEEVDRASRGALGLCPDCRALPAVAARPRVVRMRIGVAGARVRKVPQTRRRDAA